MRRTTKPSHTKDLRGGRDFSRSNYAKGGGEPRIHLLEPQAGGTPAGSIQTRSSQLRPHRRRKRSDSSPLDP
ncbi:hypothetical protein GN956_G17265 [Arapaima gigas]